MLLFATCVYLRGNLRDRLVTQRKFLRKFNLRPLAATCRSVWPGLLYKCKLISNWTRKTVWLLINNTNMKKCGKSAGRCFLKPFLTVFSHSRKLFSEFPYKPFAIALQDTALAYKIYHCFSAPKLRCVICTDVTLSAPVLKPGQTARDSPW